MANEPETQVALKPCPWCMKDLTIRGGVNPYGRCDTPGCWMNARAIAVPIHAVDQVDAWNTRPTPPEPSGGNEALARLCKRLEAGPRFSNGRPVGNQEERGLKDEAVAALRASEAREAALREELSQPPVVCDGCGSTLTDAGLRRRQIERPGTISCCPEREPIPAVEWRNRATAAERERDAAVELLRADERLYQNGLLFTDAAEIARTHSDRRAFLATLNPKGPSDE